MEFKGHFVSVKIDICHHREGSFYPLVVFHRDNNPSDFLTVFSQDFFNVAHISKYLTNYYIRCSTF